MLNNLSSFNEDLLQQKRQTRLEMFSRAFIGSHWEISGGSGFQAFSSQNFQLQMRSRRNQRSFYELSGENFLNKNSSLSK